MNSALRSSKTLVSRVRVSGAVAILATVVALGCSASSKSGSGLPSTDAIWMHFGTGDYEMKLTDYSGACAIEQAGVSHEAGGTYTAFHFVLAAGVDTLPAGTYTVTSSPTASDPVQVEEKTLDAECNTLSDVTAASGTFTIQQPLSAAGGELAGSYSLTFPDGTKSGTFSATSCTIPASSSDGTCVTGSTIPTFDAGGLSLDSGGGVTPTPDASTTGSTEACGIDMSSAACASCVTSDCCSDNTACSDDPDCVTLLSCIGACNQDMTCENNCIDATTDTAAQELDDAANCWTNSCSAQGC